MSGTTSQHHTETKIYVLDTSVLLYDHSAWMNFAEHDVVIPIQVLDEVDQHKSGNESRNLEARNFIRSIDEFAKGQALHQWLPIFPPSNGRLKVVMQTELLSIDATVVFRTNSNDHQILNVVLGLKQQEPKRQVILISKDICLRLKAQALNILSEDYQTGKLKDASRLYSGIAVVECNEKHLFNRLDKGVTIDNPTLNLPDLGANPYFTFHYKNKTILTSYAKKQNTLQPLSFDTVFGVTPLNSEQAYTFHALLNPAIKLVTIQGNAGTGKTLLALAAALEQRKNFRQIFITRPIVPLSNREIGFLPGDAKSKVNPYLEPIWDNLRFIKELWSKESGMSEKIDELIQQEKISITPLAFIRGRSLSKIFFIVDEAQNLTPHEVKTIISRAGVGTKIVFTGDIYQIDTPYLDAESNGLAYLIEKMKDQDLYAHITLQKGERSELANMATLLT